MDVFILAYLFIEYCENKRASLSTEESIQERLSLDPKKLSKKKISLEIPMQRKLFYTSFCGCQFVIDFLFYYRNVSYKVQQFWHHNTNPQTPW